MLQLGAAIESLQQRQNVAYALETLRYILRLISLELALFQLLISRSLPRTPRAVGRALAAASVQAL